jgi:hypothetical protein
MSNLAKLSESVNSPTVLSVKKADGTDTKGNLKAVNVVNWYYVEKVQKIRAGRGVQNSIRESAARPRSGDKGGGNFLRLGFANAGRISKVITGLKNTSALGTDGIPVAVLKMGSNTLAGPISHMVNMSLLAGVFPWAFKTAIIHPVY